MTGQHTDLKTRLLLESTLHKPLSLIPPALQSRFLSFHELNSRHTLARLIVLAHFTYLLYGLIDWLILPDVRLETVLIRASVCLLMAVPSYWAIRSWKIEYLDLFLPYAALIATISWLYLLHLSHSPDVIMYQYASMVFVVIANLGVHIRFLPALIPTLLISLVTFFAVYHLSEENIRTLQIFTVVYLPVFGVSLYISFNTTLRNRRTFLRRALNEWHRHALDQLAHTDMLTNLPNRRQFERLAQKEITRLQRTYAPACLLIFDVDHFKRINDNYGHDAGDLVLQAIAEITRQHWRSYDLVARFGGEEFIGFLPNTQLKHAFNITERLREKIEQYALTLPDGQCIHFTISAGIVEVQAYDSDLKPLIKAADQALYEAKKKGRNCIATAPLADEAS